MNDWMDHIQPLIDEYKDGTEEPLNGDEVERLSRIIKAKINLNEGNLTEMEYRKILDDPLPETAMAPATVCCPACGEKTHTEDPPYYHCDNCQKEWEIYEG
jgi:hypothetical protein